MFPSDPADLFVHLVRDFDADFNEFETFSWMHDDGVRDIADILERAALEDGEIDPNEIQRLLDLVDDDEHSQRVFAILMGLDRALLYANPYFGSFDQSALTAIAVRYATSGVMNSDVSAGALLPRCASPGRRQHTPNTLNDAFVGVAWVPGDEWSATNHIVVPRRNDLSRRDRQEAIDIACVAFIEDASELEWQIETREGSRFFRIRPGMASPLAERVEQTLDLLDLSGATIAVLPELALDDDVLSRWIDLLADRPLPAESNLKWIFAGSGDVREGPSPKNRCVLIDRVTAEVVLEQDKIYPFTITPEQLEEWCLTPILGGEVIEEDLVTRSRVTVAESALGRVVVLICEDLARIVDLAGPLRTQGISHVFSPVFSKETKSHHWEHMKAKEYANETGALVVVSNSLVISRLMDDQGPWGTSMAHSPVVSQIRSSLEWSDVRTFRVTAGDPLPLVGDAAIDRADDD